ncbi:MAG TPA: sialidase family protein [Pirellulales bacterium]
MTHGRFLSAEEYQGDVAQVRVVRRVEQHPGAALVWEPAIAAWKAKELVVVYGAGIPGKTDMGDIYASVSRDDGDRWSEPATVFDHRERHGAIQFGYANPILYKPPGQDVLWCFAMRCPINSRHSEDSQLTSAYSADGGRSWTPVEQSMDYTGPLILGGSVQRVQDGGHPRYLLPAHRNTRRNDPLGTREHFVLISSSLLEWRLAGFIPQSAGGRVFLQEGEIAPGEREGELKIVMRSANYEKESQATDPPRAYSSTSADGGRTWSPARPEPDLWNSNSKPFFGRSAQGIYAYVYSDGPAWSRMALRYKVQHPGGPWSAQRTFFDAGVHNSYPRMIEVSAGDWRAVWDSGTADRHRTNIRFGKIRLANSK